MAVEKLTKKRLIQIILMMIVLLSAFFYKTCQFVPDSAKKVQTTEQITEKSAVKKD